MTIMAGSSCSDGILNVISRLTLSPRDKKDRPDPKDFTLEKLTGETVGRVPGTVNGQQFIIDQCEVRGGHRVLMNWV